MPPTSFPTPGYGEVATRNFIRSQSTARAATEMANNAIYNCEVDYWNNNIGSTATAWTQIESGDVNNISTAAINDIESAEIGTRNTDELLNGGLYYGLNFATLDLKADCENYGDCILIIIDDLHIWGRNNPGNLPIDLNGVSVYTIMPNCRDIINQIVQTCKHIGLLSFNVSALVI